METTNTIFNAEIDELRAQLSIFKQRLGEQKIINDQLLRRSMQSRLNPFVKGSLISDLFGLIVVPGGCYLFAKFGVHWSVILAFALLFVIELIYNTVMYRRMNRLFTQPTDLLTMRRGLLQYRRFERTITFTMVPAILALVVVVWWNMGAFSHPFTSSGALGLRISIAALVLGLCIGFTVFWFEMRRIRQSLEEIDDMQNEELSAD